MLKIEVHIQGTAPLLQSNPRLADPLDPYTKQKKQISSIRKKLDEHYEELARLEYLGSLYWRQDTGPYLPNTVIHSNLVRGAMAKRGAKKLAQSAFFVEDQVIPLEYQGPRDLDGLLADANFRLVAPVNIKGARVMRTRPMFREWSLGYNLTLDTEIIGFEDFEAAVERAGAIEGLGDWRPTYGRYHVVSLDKTAVL